MNEFDHIVQNKDEPIALIVLGLMVVWKIVEMVFKFGFPLFTKKNKKTVEQIFAEDAKERKERQTEVDERLDKIDENIEKLYTEIGDLEERYADVSQGTLENLMFDENRSIFVRLKSFMRLIAMRVNGEIKAYGFKLVLEHKDIWRYVQGAHLELKIIDQKYFDDTMEDIEKRIFRY